MTSATTSSRMKVTLHADFSTVVNRLRQALIAGNCELLVDKNVRDLVNHQDHAPSHNCWIFGVYRPEVVAHAFVVTSESALLLPHMLTVEQVGEDLIEVSSLDPRVTIEILGNTYLAPMAEVLYSTIYRIMKAITA